MLRAGIGISTRLSPEAAATEAADAATAALAGVPPAAALIVVTSAWGAAAMKELVERTTGALACPVVVGASVDGLLLRHHEILHNPALAVLVWSGVEAESFVCDDLVGREHEAGPRVAHALSRELTADDLVMLFPDALTLAPAPLLQGLGEALAPARIVGVAAAEVPGAGALVWSESEFASGACAGIVLRPASRPVLRVTNGCVERGGPFTVTRALNGWVESLDGRPALDLYRESLPGPLRDQLERATRSVMVSLRPGSGVMERDPISAAPAGSRPAAAGPWSGAVSSPDSSAATHLVRNVVGLDPARGAFSLPGEVRRGDGLSFVSIDADAARGDLRKRFSGLPANGESAAFGCYFACRTRGARLFGHPGVEAEHLVQVLNGTPFLGMMGPYQVGPTEPNSAPGLFTYAAVLALIGA